VHVGRPTTSFRTEVCLGAFSKREVAIRIRRNENKGEATKLFLILDERPKLQKPGGPPGSVVLVDVVRGTTVQNRRWNSPYLNDSKKGVGRRIKGKNDHHHASLPEQMGLGKSRMKKAGIVLSDAARSIPVLPKITGSTSSFIYSWSCEKQIGESLHLRRTTDDKG